MASRIGSTPTFLYFDLYLYSVYAAHYVHKHRDKKKLINNSIIYNLYDHKRRPGLAHWSPCLRRGDKMAFHFVFTNGVKVKYMSYLIEN